MQQRRIIGFSYSKGHFSASQTPTLDVKSSKTWVKDFEVIYPFIDG
jgi:hypothetical protein